MDGEDANHQHRLMIIEESPQKQAQIENPKKAKRLESLDVFRGLTVAINTDCFETEIPKRTPFRARLIKVGSSTKLSDSSMEDTEIVEVHPFDELEIEPLVPLQEEEEEEEQKPIVVSQPTNGDDSEPFDDVDLTDSFTTDTVFNSRDELIQWARDVGKTVGTVVVINKSDMSNKNPRISFACERGGKYRIGRKRSTKKLVTRRSGTKRCECPFALKGVKMPKDDQWMVTVVCGVHNHPLTRNFRGNSFAGKLTLEEKEILVEMTTSGVKPKDVLNVLKERDACNASTMDTIYNARKKMKLLEVSRRLQMQQLLKKLVEHEYVEWHTVENESNCVKDLFWAHPASIKLAKCFPDVFMMNLTPKTKIRPSLLEIVGVTSTNKSFSFAFVYVEAESEDNFVWALDCMKSVLNSKILPSVIVTDRVATLMNAIKRVFPEARNFLCHAHISRDLVLNCKKMFNTNETLNAFLSGWNDLLLSYSEEEYRDRLSAFERDFTEYSCALSYVKETWLSKCKECFVAAWTDQTIHFGNTTTNTADGDLARLRRHLGSSRGNFNTMWSAVNSLLLLQHAEINASFKESLNTMMHEYMPEIFKELRGCVSLAALNLILVEVNRADSVGEDDHACGCGIRNTHGLPCAHMISRYKHEGRPIPISCIHPHWKKLSDVPTMSPNHDLYHRPEFQMFIKRYEEANENDKLELLKKLKEMATSVTERQPTS